MSKMIPITDDQKVYIANSIFRAISQDLPEIIEENHLPTSLGSGLFRWNFIYRNLSGDPCIDFEISIQPRDAWRILFLRDKVTNLTFSIMSEATFQKLQKHPTKKAHYLEALISENKNRKPLIEQLSLFTTPERDASDLKKLRDQLLSCFSGIVKEHVLVLFDYNFLGVTSARAVLLTPKMEIAFSEDWTSYLQKQYIPPKYLVEHDEDDNQLLAKLKPQFVSDQDTIVKPIQKEFNQKID